ncbi:hypothetical protein [Streptomyces sp. NPDC091371]|uniref:hypothetical protein n=1 Tax=Streptomyces sp. NPDC091371 TaxID=3155303 RepID=UPI00342851D8
MRRRKRRPSRRSRSYRTTRRTTYRSATAAPGWYAPPGTPPVVVQRVVRVEPRTVGYALAGLLGLAVLGWIVGPQDAGTATAYDGTGDVTVGQCPYRYTTLGGMVTAPYTVTIPVTITNHDTASHWYEIAVSGWAGTGGPAPQTVRVYVTPGSTTSRTVTVTITSPTAQPACQIDAVHVTG